MLALIFDFDDTMVPDSTTELLTAYDINTENFWLKESRALIDSGYDPSHAYLKCLLDLIGDDKPLGPLTSNDLKKFGQSMDAKLYPGLPELFDELKSTVSRYRDISIEFYIVSGGVQDIAEGSQIVNSHFAGVYGCQLAGDTSDSVLRYIKRAITFTEKTRYIFEINKGVTPSQVLQKPYLVNAYKDHEQRAIRFSNMIYVGDGLTDIPCFSLIKSGANDPERGGIAFAVFDPTKERSAKQALQEYLIPGRVTGAHAPIYTKDRELGSFIRSAVGQMCTRITLKREEAER
jgi:phosphoserine phosphatase